MKPTPPGWPRISTALYYEDAHAAIDWLCRAFGFEVRLKVEGDDGAIHHSELVFGDGLVMVSSGDAEKRQKYPWRRSPSEVNGFNTQNVMVFVDDVEAHLARAQKAGATIVTGADTHDYGEEYWVDRTYECIDLGGHHWWFTQRMKTGKG